MLGCIQPQFSRNIRDHDRRLIATFLGRYNHFEVTPIFRMLRPRCEISRIEVIGDIQNESNVYWLLCRVKTPRPSIKCGPDTSYKVGLSGIRPTDKND